MTYSWAKGPALCIIPFISVVFREEFLIVVLLDSYAQLRSGILDRGPRKLCCNFTWKYVLYDPLTGWGTQCTDSYIFALVREHPELLERRLIFNGISY